MESHSIAVQVNFVRIAASLEPSVLLVHFLREQAGLTGTHIGCDTSQCGAYTVRMDGTTVKSCTVLGVQADGHAVTTIEGLGEQARLTPTNAKPERRGGHMNTTFTERAYTSFVGRSVLRREDARMLGGRGRFTDDIQPPGVTYAIVLRSSYGHALIRSIDASRATAMAGVVGVLAQADLQARSVTSGHPPV